MSSCGEKKERQKLFLKIAFAHCYHKSQPSQGLLHFVVFLRKWMKIWARTQTGRLRGHICPAGPTSLNSYCVVGISSPLRQGTPLPGVSPALQAEAAVGVWGGKCGLEDGLPTSGPWGHLGSGMFCAPRLRRSSLETFNLPRGKVQRTS